MTPHVDAFELTVIIPTYNGAKFVGATLDSLARQSRPLAEVIVVDDGSTDETVRLVKEHPVGATLVEQTHLGVAAARNRGAARATTRFIAFLDQDDLWHAERHERLAEFFKHHPECQAVVTTERSFYREGDAPRLRAAGERMHETADFPDVIDEVALTIRDDLLPPVPGRDLGEITTRDLLGGTVSVTTSYVFERELFLVAGGCATFARSMDDYWALLNISRVGTLMRVDEPSVFYRLHPSSTTMSTHWSAPIPASLVAARYGDNLVPLADARSPRAVPALRDEPRQVLHRLTELVESGRLSDLADALAFVRLLGCGADDVRFAGTRISKRWLRAAYTRHSPQTDKTRLRK